MRPKAIQVTAAKVWLLTFAGEVIGHTQAHTKAEARARFREQLRLPEKARLPARYTVTGKAENPCP